MSLICAAASARRLFALLVSRVAEVLTTLELREKVRSPPPSRRQQQPSRPRPSIDNTLSACSEIRPFREHLRENLFKKESNGRKNRKKYPKHKKHTAVGA